MAKQNPGGDAGQPHGRRAATWLTWWVLLMSLWVAVDDSLEPDELLGGAAVAAVAALVAELVCHQAELRFQVRAAWLVQALRLPGEVVQQTVMVFGALARTVFTKAPPPRGGFRELPVAYGDASPLGVTRRVLLTAGRSLAPNEFVLGIDPDRGTMVVHRLVEKR
ncbi:MAG TPA: Na+/H+ antiporter subunit E [Trebonia sp.]|jgi:multisubunit Na+/H+ antiporter MnhE subunit|nr:Na+/H+ antiporter subunit E [Trebonia sp.]